MQSAIAGILLIGGLAIAGCATAPSAPTWTRIDGQPMTPEQLTLDQTACQVEMQTSNLNDTMEGSIRFDANGSYNTKVRALDKVYAGCMAQRGYTPQKQPQQPQHAQECRKSIADALRLPACP
jgi:hypothetical protein